MVKGILGKKLGMTRVYAEDGRQVPVTVIEAGPCLVTQVRTLAKDGYEAVQLGFGEAKRLSQPERGHLKSGGKLLRHLREVPAEGLEGVQVGQRVDVSLFQPGELVDVVGISKGKGFAGVMKRHGFVGGPKTHGQSDRPRHPGSIGSTNTPGRVIKGMRMAGHMGDARVTVRNLAVVRADPERHLL
ncbi:MAG: 50S ribosomal protein L3, partial [Chloroflexi bacterium]|nr:50S ribosomal protein L3 [Chloroflexota bacterium]